MARQFKEHVIYSDEYEYCLDENNEYDPTLAELNYEDERINLDMPLDGRVVAIGQIQKWNGLRQGYMVSNEYKNLNDILRMGNEDRNTVYYDRYNVYKRAIHHDGTNIILFREIRENRDVYKFLTMVYSGKPLSSRIINYYTKSLRPYIKQVYGV